MHCQSLLLSQNPSSQPHEGFELSSENTSQSRALLYVTTTVEKDFQFLRIPPTRGLCSGQNDRWRPVAAEILSYTYGYNSDVSPKRRYVEGIESGGGYTASSSAKNMLQNSSWSRGPISRTHSEEACRI